MPPWGGGGGGGGGGGVISNIATASRCLVFLKAFPMGPTVREVNS